MMRLSTAVGLIAPLITVLPLRAQSPGFALQLGLNTSTFQYRDPTVGGCANCYATTITGVDVGASVGIPLQPWLMLEPGLSLAGKGAVLQGNFTMRMRYLELPLALRLMPTRKAYGVLPFALVGIVPAQRLACSIHDIATNPGPGGPPTSSGVCAAFRGNDLGRLMGAGVAIDGGRLQYRAEFRRIVGVDVDRDPYRSLRNDVRSLLVVAQLNRE